MRGPIALVGSGEFTAAMEEIDRDLLAAASRSRPRVAILPTASWPDGDSAFRGWIERGRAHFSALGAEVEGVEIRTREDAFDGACAQAIGEADLVYLSGGKPGYLLDVLAATPAEAALRAVHERGGTLAGCSAGAMVLAARQPRIVGRRFIRLPTGWRHALGLVEGAAVLPHYDAFPEPIAAAAALVSPRGMAVLGVDEETVAIGRNGTWHVQGRGRVTVWRGRARTRYRAGESFRLGDPEEEPAVADEDRP
ncbi:MAG: Type 1 glutamine amidotransferase-like domain-containing protein [Chloroflexota bacterium]